jgi:glycosyltransferase involved in cell wall biosynthesis
MAPYRIVHLLETAEVEGTSFAGIVASLAEHLHPTEYALHAWFRRGRGPLVEMLERKGVAVRVLDWQGGERSPLGLTRFLGALLVNRFAILHQHVGGRSIRLLARHVAGARVLTHLHGRVLEQRGGAPFRCNLRGADLVAATSRSVAGWAGARAEVVYPGVDVPPRLPGLRSAGRGRVLGAAGRLAPIKGLEYLLQALAIVQATVPEVALEIAGSGPEEASLRDEVNRLGLEGRVRFLGWQEEIPFQRWDVFVMPSLEEAFGIAALEAMAAGLPVVGSAVGGLPELIEDGRTGCLTPPADSRALAERLIPLLLDGGLRGRMGAAAWARAGSFTARRMCEEIEKRYRRLLT